MTIKSFSYSSAPRGQDTGSERSIGDIIRQANNLSPEQIEKVLKHQKEYGIKFGEAAVAVGVAKREDVLWALAQQFHYPYTTASVGAELRVATQPFSDQSEAFRSLRTQLISSLYSKENERRPLAVVSPDVGDGKTYLAANLAVAFSQLGVNTLLVDADLRSPRLDQVFRIKRDTGLSGVLSGRNDASVIRPVDDLPRLFLLPVGVVPPNPLELVQGPGFGQLLDELVQKFDFVIVDTPAWGHGSDAKVIASVCGAALAVARRNVTKIQPLSVMVNALKKSVPKFSGVVLNEY